MASIQSPLSLWGVRKSCLFCRLSLSGAVTQWSLNGTQLPLWLSLPKSYISAAPAPASFSWAFPPGHSLPAVDDVESQSFIRNETPDETVFTFDRWLHILFSRGGNIPEGPSGCASL